MSKIRVHEYAKKHNISSKDLMTKLKEMNIEVSNHMTMLDDEVVNKLDNEYQTEKPSVADEFEVEEKVVRSKKNSNKKKKKGKGNEDKRQENFAGRQQTQIVETPDKITFSGSLTVGDLAKKLSKEPSEIIKKLFMLGIMATINQDLDKDTIELIANDYGIEVEEEVIV
ncbi:MAG TPA: translation initiation factor IF-2, partial [Bacillus sp. (in: Bacteria)]|nr:translation initiation factor IF-2 [Bacillus sp. (in: firmicutes)]